MASFYNHYGDLFSEDLVGPPIRGNQPASHSRSDPAEFGNGLVAITTGGNSRRSGGLCRGGALRGSYSFLDMHVKKGTNSKDIGSAPGVQGSSPEHQVLLQSGFDLPKSVEHRHCRCDTSARLPGIKVPSYWTAMPRFNGRCKASHSVDGGGPESFSASPLESSYDPGPAVGIRRRFYGEITFPVSEPGCGRAWPPRSAHPSHGDSVRWMGHTFLQINHASCAVGTC